MHSSSSCLKKVNNLVTSISFNYDLLKRFFNIAYLICEHLIFRIPISLIGPMLSMLPTISVKTSVCINPILYIVMNRQVRLENQEINKRLTLKTNRKNVLIIYSTNSKYNQPCFTYYEKKYSLGNNPSLSL